MKLEFGYAEGVQTIDVPDKNLKHVLVSNPVEGPESEQAEILRALANPIGSARLRDLAKPGQKIAVVSSDISRPMPTGRVMPYILDELYSAGVSPKDITLVFGLGSHRHHTEEEKRHLAGERAWAEIRCEDSNPEDVVRLGVTSKGTPVDITRTVADADFIICMGNIEFHYFAGYSGGAKAIMPGVSTPDAIQFNHRMMVSENARAGLLDGNPIRDDIEEAGKICGIDFLFNVVLDEHKHISFAVSGDSVKAHRAGCEYLDKMFLKPIDEKADIVIVSQGGAPKDANLYQTQKALDNAKHAVKDGGTIILVGACNEGLGSKAFESWLLSAPSAHSMVERIGKEFELGGHKAAAIGMVLDKARIDLVSEMDPEFVKRIFLNPQPSLEKAFNEAMDRYGENASVIAMPFGGSTLPILK